MISNSADWDWDLEIDCTVYWICTKHHIEYSKRKKCARPPNSSND